MYILKEEEDIEKSIKKTWISAMENKTEIIEIFTYFKQFFYCLTIRISKVLSLIENSENALRNFTSS